VNSYFNLVVAYGDQYETLSFEDLIEVKASGESEPEVLLNNPEYAITQAIRKVANAYQAGGNVFANLQKPVTFHAYLSDDKKLPKALADLSKELKSTLQEIQKDSDGKFKVDIADPEADGGKLARKLHDDYGFSAQIASLFDPKPFWFYMLLQGQGEMIQVPLPAELDASALKKSIQAAVQRMAPGYLKTVAIVTPPAAAMNPMMMMQMGMRQPGGKHYDELRDALAENVRLRETDLKDGHVPADADMLLLLAPKDLDQKQLFAIDQFLMKGGSVVIASGAFDVSISDSLNASKNHSGLEDWLKHNGLTLADSMVLDPQNASLPVPVRRQLGPMSVREIKMMPYPHFPDIREDGLNEDNPMTASLGQLTLNWASPVTVDADKNKGRDITQLLHSSDQSWTSSELNVLPEYRRYPDTGFKPEDQRASQLLAVAVKGSFESYFKGKETPLLEKKEKEKDDKKAESAKPEDSADETADQKEEKTVVSSIIERSSDSARIILIGSNNFATDEVISLASQGQGSHYTRPLEFMQNAIDWSLDDNGLMAIRSRAQFARVLKPMEHSSQLFWEYLNYALAIAGLIGVALWRRTIKRKNKAHYDSILAQV
jgi:ABC-2 type transport system permease protein